VESQISPIPPDRYGDRFVRFISGITKSSELAQQEQVEKYAEKDGPSDDFPPAMHRSPTDKVMEKAERQAERSSQDLAISDGEAPNRQISTARSPSAERGDPSGFTLPVVEEAAESQSTGGRSSNGHRSENPSPSPQPQPRHSHHSERGGQRPPPTPPKDDADTTTSGERLGTPPMSILRDSKTASGDGPPTPPSERKKRAVNMDKALPSPPPSTNQVVA